MNYYAYDFRFNILKRICHCILDLPPLDITIWRSYFEGAGKIVLALSSALLTGMALLAVKTIHSNDLERMRVMLLTAGLFISVFILAFLLIVPTGEYVTSPLMLF
ncbi:hypothetical protein [Moorella stamsii]|uniref:hypothetical protein n=1 Tax=Neomoorella stamsii TaxID=1266720 RepID=UPI0006D52C3C|nr:MULTISPECIES: hypothetical protein [Moorella]